MVITKKLVLKILGIILILIVIGLLGFGVKVFLDSQQQIKELQDKLEISKTTETGDPKVIVDKISHHMVLPKGEPSLVTIANVELLKKDQPFFAPASNGDKLLVYPDKVILYSPTLDRIIDIAGIRPNSAATTAAQIDPTRTSIQAVPTNEPQP